MKPFYSDTRSQTALKLAALEWLNTPFVPHANVCGAGVDCVNLCAQIYIQTGFLKSFTPPKYVMDGGKHNTDSQLLEWIEISGRFQLVQKSEPVQTGDLLCFKTGKSAHHTGLITNAPHFLHCLFNRKVTISTLSDRTFQRVLVAVYRPMEVVA